MVTRSQVFTLEAFVAALILLPSIVFALQLTAVTPLSASTSSQYVETQQRELLEGTLDSARANGSLRVPLLSWDAARGTFHDAGASGYVTECSLGTAFGALLERTFAADEMVCNVALHYNEGDRIRTERLIHVGTPPDTAVSVSRTVTLYDDDVLYDAAGQPTNTTLNSTSAFYATDQAPNSPVYTVVRVEVTVWQT